MLRKSLNQLCEGSEWKGSEVSRQCSLSKSFSKHLKLVLTFTRSVLHSSPFELSLMLSKANQTKKHSFIIRFASMMPLYILSWFCFQGHVTATSQEGTTPWLLVFSSWQ